MNSQEEKLHYQSVTLKVSMRDTELCTFLTKSRKAKPCFSCPIDAEKAGKFDSRTIAEGCLRALEDEIKALVKTPKTEKIDRFLNPLIKLEKVTNPDNDIPLDGMQQRIAERVLNLLEKGIHDLTEDPKDAGIQLNLGNIFFNLGLYKNAVKYFEKAIEIDPNNHKAFNNIGVTLVRLKRPIEALSYYEKALNIDAEFGNAWFNKGKALYTLDRKREALECFRRATQFSPENKSAWNNLGVTMRYFERFDDAIRCYDEALKVDNNYAWAWHNKGIALAELRRYKEAMRCFDKALQIDPGFDAARQDKRDLMRRMI